ncbi:hypothetical protein PEX1_047240 [Penicillium expansum]|uniref:Uncharacterized protein n=1 Tax=Penicillium expansum TaxID=27334 RepID=A0A0A2IZ56_PENEN|nr:hypothetical protein PEX2_063460 [Penicillium expansum]KGO44021.1 hypothetical protein PEX1_047240 [Penicillium expansum]KGO47816.1 hypothetical protein PEXP_070340 [Penicillium expansum]KGO50708.1 hypothetical protein PEX2_063460 [Penicillium expansum]
MLLLRAHKRGGEKRGWLLDSHRLNRRGKRVKPGVAWRIYCPGTKWTGVDDDLHTMVWCITSKQPLKANKRHRSPYSAYSRALQATPTTYFVQPTRRL